MSSYIATCLERSADLAEWLYEQNVGVGEWMGDTPQTVMTTRAPVVLKKNTITNLEILQMKIANKRIEKIILKQYQINVPMSPYMHRYT